MVISFSNTSYVRNTTYRPIFKFFFWLFISDCIILTWLGQMPVRTAFVLTGQVATVYYFVFFLFLIPIIGKIETILATNSTDELPMAHYKGDKSLLFNYHVYNIGEQYSKAFYQKNKWML